MACGAVDCRSRRHDAALDEIVFAVVMIPGGEVAFDGDVV